jgi:hypothetical protein
VEARVTGLPRLDRNIGGFQVADLAHHDDAGSWRRNARELAQVRPAFSLTLT